MMRQNQRTEHYESPLATDNSYHILKWIGGVRSFQGHSKAEDKQVIDDSKGTGRTKSNSDGTLSENTETKMTPKRHNHHLIEVLSDKELSIYLEAFVANYKPGALGGLKLWGLVSSELEPAVLYAAHLLGNSNVRARRITATKRLSSTSPK